MEMLMAVKMRDGDASILDKRNLGSKFTFKFPQAEPVEQCPDEDRSLAIKGTSGINKGWCCCQGPAFTEVQVDANADPILELHRLPQSIRCPRHIGQNRKAGNYATINAPQDAERRFGAAAEVIGVENDPILAARVNIRHHRSSHRVLCQSPTTLAGADCVDVRPHPTT
jgi:hypothetical protein